MELPSDVLCWIATADAVREAIALGLFFALWSFTVVVVIVVSVPAGRPTPEWIEAL
jgi:hypothetical protein